MPNTKKRKVRTAGISSLFLIIVIFTAFTGAFLPNLYVNGYYGVNNKCYWHTGKDWYVWNNQWETCENPTTADFPIKNKIIFGYKEVKEKYKDIQDFKETHYYDLYVADSKSQKIKIDVVSEAMRLDKVSKGDLIEGKEYQLNYFGMPGDLLTEKNLYKMYTLKDGTEIYAENLKGLVKKDLIKGNLEILNVGNRALYVLKASKTTGMNTIFHKIDWKEFEIGEDIK